MTFEELYHRLAQDKAQDRPIDWPRKQYDQKQMDCLLRPDNHPLIWKVGTCAFEDKSCVAACLFDAIDVQNGALSFDPEKCTGIPAKERHPDLQLRRLAPGAHHTRVITCSIGRLSP